MTILCTIILMLFLWVPKFKSASDRVSPGVTSTQDSLLIGRMKRCRIVLKDGTIKKDCQIVAIHDHWIEYKKDGSLHDLLIESIRRIEIQDGRMNAVFFDEKHRPVLGSYVY